MFGSKHQALHKKSFRTTPQRRKHFFRKFEPLEDRRLLAILTVTTTVDELDGGSLLSPAGADGKLSLREAINVANLNPGPDTILLAAKSTYKITIAGGGEDANQRGDFDVLDNLTIKATGKGWDPIIDGFGLDRVFNIPTGHNGISLTFCHVVITGGIARTPGSGNGGGVDAESTGNTLSFFNTTVTKNIVTSPNLSALGGGIFNRAGDINVIESHIDDNHAAAGIGGDGGGIYLAGAGVLTIKKSTVNNNSAYNSGGGIEDLSNNAFTVTDSQINNNHAGNDDGGGAEVHSQFVTISGSTFNNNTSAFRGGGLEVGFGSGGLITITKSKFINNTATDDGGALFCGESSLIICGSTFKDNTSNTTSGNSGGGAIDDAGSVTATDSWFIHNVTVHGNGGAIHQEEQGGDIIITRCTFANNSASGNEFEGRGGAIRAEGATGDKIYLTDSTFTANNSTDDGGAVFAAEDPVIIVRCTFKDNVAGSSGGAVDDAGAIQATDSCFNHNVAGNEAGALHQEVAGDITIVRCTFTKNQANTDEGGAILAFGETDLISVTDSKFTYNSAVGDGGAIYAAADKVTVLRSTFDHNTSSTGDGGAIADAENGITVTDSCFTNNSAKADGGAFATDGGDVTVIHSVISGNIATNGEGGGFSNQAGSGTVVMVIDSTICGNTAGGNGGGFVANGQTLTMTGSTVSDNRSGSQGGGIYIATYGTATGNYPIPQPPGSLIANCTISGNGAAVTGGGIDFEGDGDLTIINVTIAFNASFNGGGIAQTGGGGFVHIGNTIVAMNTATNGPDIYDTQTAFDDFGHNLFFSLVGQGTAGIDDPSGSSPAINADNDRIRFDPLLGPLANNGGPTKTHALLAGSPAIDAADDALRPLTDQRGVSRPQGLHADIGAYEKKV